MKHSLLGLLALTLLLGLGGCARKEKLTVVLEWQRPVSEACLACRKCGVNEDDVQRACAELKDKLAAKGIAVEFVVKQPQQSDGPGSIRVCDIPLEAWLGAETLSAPCAGCPPHAGRTVMHHSLALDGQTFDIIPADLMVRAGLSAADQLLEHGKIDASLISVPKGCAGCPSAGNCNKQKAGGTH